MVLAQQENCAINKAYKHIMVEVYPLYIHDTKRNFIVNFNLYILYWSCLYIFVIFVSLLRKFRTKRFKAKSFFFLLNLKINFKAFWLFLIYSVKYWNAFIVLYNFLLFYIIFYYFLLFFTFTLIFRADAPVMGHTWEYIFGDDIYG